MIDLTRLNGSPLILNSDLIKSAEASPDTMITLLTGEKLIVRESCAEVVARMVAFRAQLLSEVAKLMPSKADPLRMAATASLSGTLASEETGDSIAALYPESAQRRRRREETEE